MNQGVPPQGNQDPQIERVPKNDQAPQCEKVPLNLSYDIWRYKGGFPNIDSSHDNSSSILDYKISSYDGTRYQEICGPCESE